MPRPFRQAPKKLDATSLQNYANSALAARAMSSAELRRKLKAKAADPADIEPIVAKLAEYGAIDDQKFASTYAVYRKQNQSFGAQRVLRDLRTRNVAPEIAAQATSEAFAGTDEIQLIEEHLARKFRGKNLPEYLKEPKHVASAFRRLRTAGFSSSNSMKVLRRYADFIEEIDVNEEEEAD